MNFLASDSIMQHKEMIIENDLCTNFTNEEILNFLNLKNISLSEKNHMYSMIDELRKNKNVKTGSSNIDLFQEKSIKNESTSIKEKPSNEFSSNGVNSSEFRSENKELKSDIVKINIVNLSGKYFRFEKDDKIGFTNAFNFFKTKIEEKRISLSKITTTGAIQILDINAKSQNNQEIILEPLEDYKIIPSFIQIQFLLKNQIIDNNSIIDQMILSSQFILNFVEKNDEIDMKEEDKQIFLRFKKMLSFFSNRKYAQFSVQDIENCRKKLKINCAGFDYYSDKIYEEFIGYMTSSIYALPKGILFYGPPRTGKTHVSKKILEFLPLFRIHPDLAAGDFKKPLQGQGEQMINKITERCDSLPWELCVLFIDEIDGLCPNRKGAGSSESSSNLIGVFLAITDGNKIKKNLMLMGTSNRLKQMDDAFLQRLDIKLFVGLPNSNSRKDWVKRVSEQATPEVEVKGKKISKIFLEKVQNCLNKKLIDDITVWTLNFTADAMKKSISQIMTKTLQMQELWNESEETILKKLRNIVFTNLDRISSNDKIYLSNYTPPAFVNELSTLNDERYQDIPWDIFVNSEAKGQKYNLTKRILIDFKENQTESFQFELIDESEFKEKKRKLLIRILLYLKKLDQFNNGEEEFLALTSQCDQNFEELKKCFPDYFQLFDENFKNVLESDDDYDRFIERNKLFQQLEEQRILDKMFLDLDQKNLFTFGLTHDRKINSKEEVLKILIKMATRANLNYVLVLDSAYFIKNNIMTDEGMACELVMACEEAIQYDSCLIVFDLEVADITKSYSNLLHDLSHSTNIEFLKDKEEPKFSYSYNRNTILRAALEFFSLKGKSNNNHWFVALSNHNKITLDFKEKTCWPPSHEQENIENKIRFSNLSHICDLCGEIYRAKDNDPNSCGKHQSEFLYDEDVVNQLKNKNKNNENYDPFGDPEKKDSILFKRKYLIEQSKSYPEMKLSKYKWLCCGKGLYDKGEIKCEHVSKGIWNKN